MLLNDIGKSPNSTFRKINQHLETNYGFKIAEDVSDKDLVAIMEQIEDEITELKVKGGDAKASPEISKRLLVLEGIKSLREFALVQFQSPDLEHVVNGLADYVHDCFRLSGTTHQDFEECVRDGMKHYRSSKYRFPDDMIEQRVRQAAMSKVHGPGMSDGTASPMSEMDVEQPILGEAGSEDDEGETDESTSVNTLDETDQGPYGNMGKRAGALGGHAADMPNTPQARHAMKSLDNPSLSLSPQHEPGEEQPKMVRDKSGRMVPDPFDVQRIARRKGVVMKENLIKNLRRLLETEVSQAEVMMAAKGFAQELQEMIEKIGRLQNEDLPPVTDQMRETYGTDSSSAFQTQIYGALQGVMDALYTAKGQVDDAVSNMASTGQVSAETDMDVPMDGMDDMGADMGDIDAEAGLAADLDNISGEEMASDEFGGADQDEPLGRSKKVESVNHLQRKVLEMQRLVAKAKKLKEAKK